MREAIAESERKGESASGSTRSPFLAITCLDLMPLPSPDDLADRNVDSTDTELRYAAYGARLRTALRASQRYLAYVCLFPHLALLMIHLRSTRPVTSEKPFDPSYLPFW